MNKIYRSTCELHFQVAVNGVQRNVDFEPRLNHYIYTSAEKDLQKALEAHPDFGDMYVLDMESLMEAQTTAEEEVVAEVAGTTEEKEKAEGNTSIMQFANNQDAKSYLVDTFGISTTKLRTKADIEAQAKDSGIIIEWV